MGIIPIPRIVSAAAPTDSTLSITDTFDRADTDYGTLGTTSDGKATWVNQDPDPGFGFRILSNLAQGSSGTNHQTIDVKGTRPGIVSGNLIRQGTPTQGALSLLYSVTRMPSGDFSHYALTRLLAFADLFELQVVYDFTVVETLASFSGLGWLDSKVGLRVNGSSVEVYQAGALHGTYTVTTTSVPPVTSLHGIKVNAQPSCAVNDWSFVKDA